MAPKVQTLAEAMAELNPAYDATRNIIGQKQSGVAAKYDAQRSGLAAEKVQGFNQINNQATGRGMSFSGIPLDEQSTYLSTKYLPGIQAANAAQNQEELSYAEQLAQLDREMRTSALGRIDTQKAAQNQWNMQERQIQASAAQAAANRAADAPSGPSRQQIIAELNAWTKGKTGKKDGKLSPTDFRAGYQTAAGHGLSWDDYVAVMGQYINRNHAKDYIG